LGTTYYNLNEFGRALTAAREAVRLKPDDAGLWYQLGLDYAALGDHSEVIKVYDKLRILAPTMMAETFFKNVVSP